jgi:hypothetical protein
MTGASVNDAVVSCIWDLLGSGRNQNYQTASKSLKLILRALRKCEIAFDDTPVQLLHETAFLKLFQRAEALIPDYPKAAFFCACAAIRVHPQVMFHRDQYRKMGRMLLRAFPRINSVRKSVWPPFKRNRI